MRRVIAALIVVGLAIGVFFLWPRDGEEPPDTQAVATTTTSTTAAPSTTVARTTSTSGEDTRVVETVEEAEQILRELWFGWFEGIYNQDEERIREVVGNPAQIEAAVEQFGDMEFDAAPSADALVISDIELLRSDAECLAVWAVASGSFRVGEIEGVHVFRPKSGSWLLINTWPRREDIWENDCDVTL